MLGAFRYYTCCWVRSLVHPYKVVAVKTLFFGRVVFTYWGIVLNWSYIFKRFAILSDVLNVHGALLFFWSNILFVNIDDVLCAFCYYTGSWVRSLVHPYKVVTIEALFFCRVIFADWGIILNWSYIFKYFAILSNVLNIYATLLFYWCFWVLSIYVNNVFSTFFYITCCVSWEFTHPHEVVAVEALLSCFVVWADFSVLNYVTSCF